MAPQNIGISEPEVQEDIKNLRTILSKEQKRDVTIEEAQMMGRLLVEFFVLLGEG